MSFGLCFTTVSFAVIVYNLVQTERSKREIMTIFAMLSKDDVKLVYDICDGFIDRFDNGEDEMGRDPIEEDGLEETGGKE